LAPGPAEDHAILEEALAVATSSGSPRLRQIVVGTMSEVALEEGDFGRAMRLAEQARSLAEEVGDRRELSWTCFDVGLAAARMGEQARAEAAFTEGLSHARQRGDDPFATVNLWGLAELALEQKQFEAARLRGLEALKLAARSGDNYTAGACLHVLGRAAAGIGQHQRAARLLGAADTRREVHHREAFDYADVWYTRRKPRESMTEEIVHTVRHALGARRFEQAWESGSAMSLEEASAYALEADQ
jgi:non-specific serine/threonine protein kinase